MRGILIFDHLNDVIFTKCDRAFACHVQKLATAQGLLSEIRGDDDSCPIPSANVIMQLFSPIITSEHVMTSQFGNSYTSMKCHNGTNLVFDEFMSYTFLYISTDGVEIMRRKLGICVFVVKHLCGPNIDRLKSNRRLTSLVSLLLDAWTHLYGCEQTVLLEAVEQLSINSDLSTATLKVLHEASDKLKAQPELANHHVLVLVEHKFLSLYSSKNAQDLSASDILLMVLLCWVANGKGKDGTTEFQEKDEDEDLLIESSMFNKEDHMPSHRHVDSLSNPMSVDIADLFEGSRDSSMYDLKSLAEDSLCKHLVLLESTNGFSANAVYIYRLAEGINLLTIVEVTNLGTSSGLYDSFYYLNVINGLQLQKDIDDIRPAFDNLDMAIKKALESIRKNKLGVNNDVDMCHKRLQVKWDFVRKKYTELIKTRDPQSILQIESNTSGFTETMKELFRLTCFNDNFLKLGTDVVLTVSRLVRQKLLDFSDFFRVKALKNFTLGSINKYLEEFPGLVHFMYIDRTMHRLTTPTLDFSSPETLALTTRKIWAMVDQSRTHLQEGILSVMWKDTTFNYAYFLWFEDSSGSPLKCKTYMNHLIKNFPVPGILCGDYYRKLAETCFPKISINKIRIYELYCVHLGLATPSCVLEHSRRLAATICEVTGFSNNPADIL
ncbi:Hermansky-Pudlak syndrome 1 protein homolog isoform X2 [Orussus abietinus]|uniref:Hermansky-Pudlak syndrome 1 protein homolog isoform X2 n=1 Tax=Orussus abietinus TaxID=222816 RepID=UPI0006264710|nr:Hermansky-Pudlak syndrome 1 protein homolog isoform X2 [Orussus abietinus]